MRESLHMAIASTLLLLAALAIANPVSSAERLTSVAQQTEGRPGQPIIIRWSTETEVNTAGFNVYRAFDQDGPWEKVNPRLIPGSPDPLRGGSYVFTDTNVIAGVTYWYELEEIELSGRALRLERTTATAQARNPLSGLPCATGLPVLAVFVGGTMLIAHWKRSYGLA